MINDETKAEMIVDILIDDLTDRAGIGSEWYGIDTDTQDDIKEEWKRLILEVLED